MVCAMAFKHLIQRLLLGLILSTPVAAEPVLERGNGPEPDSLDPHRAQGLSAHQILRDLYEGLTRIDANGHTVPAAAERFEVDESGLRWCFVLRAGLRWSDGQALTSADFAAALSRALDPSTLAPYASLLEPLRGAPALLGGTGDAASLGLQTPDAQTLCTELQRPTPDWLSRLALPVAMPFRDGQLDQRPYNGPYVLEQARPQSHVLLRRNDVYAGSRPARIERVRFHVTPDAAAELNRYAAGELHLTETLPPGQLARLRERYAEQIRVGPAYASYYYGYNLTKPPFAGNLALRQALSLALDREVLTRYISAGGELPLDRLVPPLPSAAAGEVPAQQRELARQRYRQAGYGEHNPLRVELRYNTGLSHRRMALAVAAQWREVLGVQTVLRHEEWKVFVSNRRARRVTEVFRAGWVADYVDPISFLEGFVSDSPLNAVGYSSAAYDRLIRSAGAEIRAAERARLLRQAEALLLADQAILPIYAYTSKHLVSPALCGFQIHPLDHHPSAELYFCDQESAP